MLFVLVSCKKSDEDLKHESNDIVEVNTSLMFEQNDEAIDSSNFIKLKNDIDDNYIYIKNGGSYLFEGDYNKTIIIESNKNIVHLKFSNANFDIKNFAALYIKDAKKVILTLEGINKITINDDILSIDENSVDAAIFSKSELTINGDGILSIDSTSNGICTKDILKIVGANVNISALNHGIDSNDSVRLKDANIKINAKYDGIHSANANDLELGYIYVLSGLISIECGSDGVSASNYLYIENIDLNITNKIENAISDIYSKKGIKATNDIVILSGVFVIDTLDDSIHSNKSIKINAGSFDLSSMDDGIHADSSIIINDGKIEINQCYEGIEAQNITINDGVISLYASDDGFNCAGGVDQDENFKPGRGPDQFDTDEDAFLIINDGSVYVNANGDGLDSNGYIEINGGNIVVEGPTNSGNGSLDFGISAKIGNATFISIGSSGMASNFTDSSQGVIMYNMPNTYLANSTIKLIDEDSNVLLEFVATKKFSSIILSSLKIEKGQTYTLIVDSDEYSVTLNSLIYSNGGGGNRPPHGGRW